MSPDDRLKIATARLVGFCQSIENVRGYVDGNQEVKIPIAWVNSLLRATGVCNSILDQVLAEMEPTNERSPVSGDPHVLSKRDLGLCWTCSHREGAICNVTTFKRVVTTGPQEGTVVKCSAYDIAIIGPNSPDGGK